MKNYKIELKWTAVFVAMAIVWHIVEHGLGFHGERIAAQQGFNRMILVPAVIIYVLALRDKRKNFYEGIMTYKQGLWSGFMLSVMVSLISPVYSYINLKLISPEFFPNMINYASSAGLMTRAEAEAQFTFTNYVIIGVVAGVVTGLILSSIIMIFLRFKPHHQKVA